jgi:hypothetical protein
VLLRPTSTQELADGVKALAARAAAEGRGLKLRPARDWFGTMNAFPCTHLPEDPSPEPAGPGGKAPLLAGILMNGMNKVLSVDHAAKQMRVQGQITLKEFYGAATAAGLSIQRSALPWWQGLTLAGVMATTSHGSGLNRTSMIVSLPCQGQGREGSARQLRTPCCPAPPHPARPSPPLLPQSRPLQMQCDWMVSVTWVDAAGEIHVSEKGSEEARGLCGGVGLFGVITELVMQMTEPTNTHVSTWYVRDDADIANDVEKMLKVGRAGRRGGVSRGIERGVAGVRDGLTLWLGGWLGGWEPAAVRCSAATALLPAHCPHPPLPAPAPRHQKQITPHLVVMWRPDIGKYTGHMQRPAAPDAKPIKEASCNVIPQFAPLTARALGPGLRSWQADPFNKDASYAVGQDAMVCATALTNAVGAAWVTKPSPASDTLGTPIPVLEGDVPTNQVASTDCGDRCAWLSKDMQATALVGGTGARRRAGAGGPCEQPAARCADSGPGQRRRHGQPAGAGPPPSPQLTPPHPPKKTHLNPSGRGVCL